MKLLFPHLKAGAGVITNSGVENGYRACSREAVRDTSWKK